LPHPGKAAAGLATGSRAAPACSAATRMRAGQIPQTGIMKKLNPWAPREEPSRSVASSMRKGPYLLTLFWFPS